MTPVSADEAWGDVEPTPVPFASGAWQATLRGDEVADLRFSGVDVLRSVRAVLRDRDWNTVPVAVTALHEVDGGLDLDLAYEGYGARLDGVLRLRAVGEELSVEFDGDNRVDFLRCRVGLVVLHPPAAAGAALAITHPDGSVTATAFPVAVSPHQPAFDITRLAWTADGVAVDLAFEGEVFEMEDQRNWTDASFKTYSTPLALPFPVLLAAGERVRQRVVLRASGSPVPAAAPRRARLVPTGAPVPELVVGAATGPRAPQVEGLPAVRLVELALRDANWRAALNRAAEEVPGGALEVRLVAASPDQVEAALDALDGLPVRRLGVYSDTSHVSEPELWEALVAGVAARGIEVDLVGGARSHYTELNREGHRLPAGIPALTFSLTPQMHARERAQLVESIPMLRVVVEDALAKAGGRLVHVGPITLRPRFNAVATSSPTPDPATDVDAGYGPERDADATDPRQASPAAGAWFLAALAAAAVPGIASIAVAESSGPRGLQGSALDAVRAATPLTGHPLLVARDLPPRVSAFGAVVGDEVRVLAANLGGDDVRVVCDVETPGGTIAVDLDVPAWGVVQRVVAAS